MSIAATDDRRILTVAQVAEVLQVHPDTVYARIRGGQLRATHIGGCIRILPAELDRFLESATGEK